MDDASRQRDIARVREAHQALVDHLVAMSGGSGADAALPSLLPDWTRGHVLTHIARNADSFVRPLRRPAGRGGHAVRRRFRGRNADIEAGATRDWAALVDDVRSSAAALEEVFAAQDRWDLAMTNSPGRIRAPRRPPVPPLA